MPSSARPGGLGQARVVGLRARHRVTPPSTAASAGPGTTPAMNNAPTGVVATEYITITMDGGIRMPRAPEVVITPAPKRLESLP